MDSSPFAALPAELRNHIWSLALQQDNWIGLNLYTPEDIFGAAELRSTKGHVQENALAITTTCRALRHETTQLFYSINTFEVHDGGRRSALTVLREFRKQIGGESFSAIGKLVIQCRPVFFQGSRYQSVFQELGNIGRVYQHGKQYIGLHILLEGKEDELGEMFIDLRRPWHSFRTTFEQKDERARATRPVGRDNLIRIRETLAVMEDTALE